MQVKLVRVDLQGKGSVSKYELSVKSILMCAACAMCCTRKTSSTAVEQSGVNVLVAVDYTRSVLKTVLKMKMAKEDYVPLVCNVSLIVLLQLCIPHIPRHVLIITMFVCAHFLLG